MKTIMRCLVMMFAIATIYTQSNAQWVPTNGFGGAGNIQALVASGENIFAGTNSGLFLSTNSGVNWNIVLKNNEILNISACETNVFLSTWNDGILRSTNNGISWSPVNTPFSYINEMIEMGTNLFAGTNNGLYTSSDNGASWTMINTGFTNTFVTSIASIGSNLFVVTQWCVLLSTNNGTNWTKVISESKVSSLCVSGTNLFVGTNYGIFFSTDKGSSWTVTGEYPDRPQIYYSESLIALGSNLFAGTIHGIFISTNNGTEWTAINSGLPLDLVVNSLVLSGGNLFAGTNSGVFVSTNNGLNWTSISSGLPVKPLPKVSTFAVSGSNLFAGTTGCVYRTTNKGADWTKLNNGLPVNKSVFSLESIGTNLFAGTDSGVYISSNNGASWTAINTGLTGNYVRVCTDGTGRGLDSSSGTNLFAGTDKGVFLSTNNGTNWSKTTLDTVAVSSFAVNGTNLFAGTNKGLFLSVNNGVNWNYLGFTNVSLVYVLPIKADSAIIFVSWNEPTGTDEGNKVFSRSMNNGGSWVRVGNIFPSSLAHSGITMFAGISRNFASSNNSITSAQQKEFGGSIFCSNDYGKSWTGVDTGFSYVNSVALAVFGDNLFAGPRFSDIGNNFPGVWRRPLSEMIPATDSLLVPVAGGTFTAGTTPVTISSFKMDKYEVTYELWTEVRTWALTYGYTDMVSGLSGSSPEGTNNPVTMVNWYDVVKWCNARSEKDGLIPVYYTRSAQDTVYRTGELNINVDAVKWTANGYRLPTEAEWEFAAKGGTQAHVPPFTYSGSNTLDSVAWYSSNSGNKKHTVGTKKANELGIYDMSGNVWEWCWDWYGSAYPSGGTADPKGPSATQNSRLIRGGSFHYLDYVGDYCWVDYRSDRGSYPGYRGSAYGFRCVQGSHVGTAVKDETETPQTFMLAQNYPNPFNPTTTIRYSLPSSANVKLAVYDLLGREIATLVNEEQSAGWKEVEWNAAGFASGMYLVRMSAGSFTETKKILLMK